MRVSLAASLLAASIHAFTDNSLTNLLGLGNMSMFLEEQEEHNQQQQSLVDDFLNDSVAKNGIYSEPNKIHYASHSFNNYDDEY